MMSRVLCMQMKKLKFFRTNGWEEVGVVKLNMQNGINSTQRTQTQEKNLSRDQWILLGGLHMPLELYYSNLSSLQVLWHSFDR